MRIIIKHEEPPAVGSELLLFVVWQARREQCNYNFGTKASGEISETKMEGQLREICRCILLPTQSSIKSLLLRQCQLLAQFPSSSPLHFPLQPQWLFFNSSNSSCLCAWWMTILFLAMLHFFVCMFPTSAKQGSFWALWKTIHHIFTPVICYYIAHVINPSS